LKGGQIVVLAELADDSVHTAICIITQLLVFND
jgi:hypothetical protein